MKDPYLYPDTEVLRNLQGIEDVALLEFVEADYTGLRLRQLTDVPVQGDFDFAHLCRIHRFIFQDIFVWAGVPRIINISKSEIALRGLSIDYSDASDIERDVDSVCNRMESTDWNSFSVSGIAKELAFCLSTLWRVHPFREGNTRTTIVFFCDFADKKDFPLNRELFKDNAEYVRRALVAASANLKNHGDFSNLEYIENFLRDAISI